MTTPVDVSTIYDYKNHLFTTSDYTLDRYTIEAGCFASVEQHNKALTACIAIRGAGGFIVKEKNDESSRYSYRIYTMRALTERLSLSFPIEVKSTKVKSGVVTEDSVTISYSPMKELKGPLRSRMLAYDNLSLFSDEEHTLSLYIPPQTETPDVHLIEDFIKDMEGNLYNPEALHEELATHAFRFRHPNAHFVKFFFHYSTEGETGKTRLWKRLIQCIQECPSLELSRRTLTASSMDGRQST